MCLPRLSGPVLPTTRIVRRCHRLPGRKYFASLGSCAALFPVQCCETRPKVDTTRYRDIDGTVKLFSVSVGLSRVWVNAGRSLRACRLHKFGPMKGISEVSSGPQHTLQDRLSFRSTCGTYSGSFLNPSRSMYEPQDIYDVSLGAEG